MAAPYEVLGNEFVRQYYQLFDSLQYPQLLSMYHASAMVSFEGNHAAGHQAIQELLTGKLTFQTISHLITKCDCQPTSDNGVMVLVTGRLKTDEDQPHAFSQSFYIKPESNSYFIFNDIFRLSLHDTL